MPGQHGGIVVELPQPLALDPDPPRHAEMQQQRRVAVEVGQDVFRPPPQPCHLRPGQHLHEVRRHRPAQVGAALVHPDDAPPDKMRRKAATHRFHFWQFWHFPPIRCMVPP